MVKTVEVTFPSKLHDFHIKALKADFPNIQAKQTIGDKPIGTTLQIFTEASNLSTIQSNIERASGYIFEDWSVPKSQKYHFVALA